MECKFQVGDMVVCICGPKARWRAEIGPMVGLIYTVRELRPGFHEGWSGADVLLEEISNPACDIPEIGFVEPGFRSTVFRPVKRTNISIFREMVAPKPKVQA